MVNLTGLSLSFDSPAALMFTPAINFITLWLNYFKLQPRSPVITRADQACSAVAGATDYNPIDSPELIMHMYVNIAPFISDFLSKSSVVWGFNVLLILVSKKLIFNFDLVPFFLFLSR